MKAKQLILVLALALAVPILQGCPKAGLPNLPKKVWTPARDNAHRVALTIDRTATYLRAGRMVVENMEKDETISTERALALTKQMRIANRVGLELETAIKTYKREKMVEGKRVVSYQFDEAGKLVLLDFAKSFAQAFSNLENSDAFRGMSGKESVRLGGVLKGLRGFAAALPAICDSIKAIVGPMSFVSVNTFADFDQPLTEQEVTALCCSN